MNYTKIKQIIKELEQDKEYKESCDQWKDYIKQLNIINV